MANWETVMVDTDQMEPGKFYEIQTNKDNATVLIPVEASQEKTVSFANARYLEIDSVKQSPLVQVYEMLAEGIYKQAEADIKVKPGTKIIVEMNKPMTGYIIIK